MGIITKTNGGDQITEKIKKDSSKDVDIHFRAEIEFRTKTIEEFEKIVLTLEELPILIKVAEWPKGHELEGCWPLPIFDLRIPIFERIIKNKPKIEIGPIPGGIRVAHFHVKRQGGNSQSQ